MGRYCGHSGCFVVEIVDSCLVGTHVAFVEDVETGQTVCGVVGLTGNSFAFNVLIIGKNDSLILGA